MRCWLVWGVVAAVCAAAYAQNPPNGPAKPSAPVPEDVLRALGSTDFAQREAAQKRLDDVPVEQRDALAQLAASAADPEARARLFARVDAMDDELAIHPLPISLDIKDASPQQLAQALAKSLNVPMRASVAGTHGADRFTLSVRDTPFWDVFYQLHKQNPITFNRDGQGGWTLYDDGGKADTPLEIAKGFLVEVSRATPRTLPSGGLQLIAGPAGQLVAIDASPHFPGGLAVTFRLTAEPRLNVQAMRFDVQSDLRDDEGHTLAVVSVNPTAAKPNDISWSATALIGTPAQVGKAIKSLRVSAVMTAAVDPQRVVVEHPEQMIDKAIAVGHATYTIRRFTSAAGQVNYGVDLAAGAPGGALCVIDAAGERIARSDFQNATNGGVATSSGAGQAPYTLELTAARTTKEVTLPMEWHDIPIEGQPAASGPGAGTVLVPGAGWLDGDVLRLNDIQAPGIQAQNGPVPAKRF